MIESKFKIDRLFMVQTVSHKLKKDDLNDNNAYPAFSSDSANNGIVGYTDEPEFICDNEHPVFVIFGDHTRTLNISRKSFSVLDNVKVLIPCIDDDDVLLYLFTVWKKLIPDLGYARHWKVAKNCVLTLPIQVNENGEPIIDSEKQFNDEGCIPDWDFMKKTVRRIKKSCIENVKEYLKINELMDCKLNDKDKSILSQKKIMKQFIMHDIFKKLKAPYKGCGRKQDNVSKTKNTEFSLPLINCKDGDNGIMYYGRREDFTVHKNVLSIIYNGPPTEGQTYYQKEIGLYTDAYIVGLKNSIFMDRELGLYLTTAVNKSIHNLDNKKYSRGNKATWDNKVENDSIILPIQVSTDGTPIIDNSKSFHKKGYIPDWDYMRSYIKAIEKEVITKIMEYPSR